jgi:cytochrome c553
MDLAGSRDKVSPMTLYLYRLIGAAMLDRGMYEGIEADTRATRQAALTVLLASLAAGLGAGGVWTPNPSRFALVSVIALVTWLAWAMMTFQIGTWVLPGRQTASSFGELLRTIGFAAAPGLLQVFAALPGMAIPVFVATTAWMFVAMVVGVRHALDYPRTGRALAVCGLAAGLVLAFVLIFGLLFGPALARRGAHHGDHMPHVWALERAVIRGELGATRREAGWLREHLAGVGDERDAATEANAYIQGLERLAAATDGRAAASASAGVFAACGSCHRASGLTPEIDLPPDRAGVTIASHMLRDGRAARQLLQGLVMPSDEQWAAGAAALRRAPLAPGDFPVSDRIGQAMQGVDAAVRQLGGGAAAARTPAERAESYGALAAGCASCHARHTTLWER